MVAKALFYQWRSLKRAGKGTLGALPSTLDTTAQKTHRYKLGTQLGGGGEFFFCFLCFTKQVHTIQVGNLTVNQLIVLNPGNCVGPFFFLEAQKLSLLSSFPAE